MAFETHSAVVRTVQTWAAGTNSQWFTTSSWQWEWLCCCWIIFIFNICLLLSVSQLFGSIWCSKVAFSCAVKEILEVLVCGRSNSETLLSLAWKLAWETAEFHFPIFFSGKDSFPDSFQRLLHLGCGFASLPVCSYPTANISTVRAKQDFLIADQPCSQIC